ncbi:MAG: Holliday junction branch migration protein RuvA [Nitrospirae bacterium CG_4_9_14_3_um_filter_53_35]
MKAPQRKPEMIAQIKGVLEEKDPSEIIVDVNGVGYLLEIPLSTFYQLPEAGAQVCLKAYTHVRDNAMQIFGFLTSSEKDLFEQLISVSKVGPRIALTLLSGLDTGSLRTAIRHGDVERLRGIPGVGRKTSERICMELKDKIPDEPINPEGVSSAALSLLDQCPYKDAMAALVHLGYKRGEVREVIQGLADEKEDRSVEDLIRESLRLLSKA